ncbi:M56 family metallopeptidase [Marisediminicola senii]|uniref:M56 family metallopeptidase n=1 Tax=Marisediminicola senii TaxID=2711233 RepID=UPI0013EDEFD6|nr:M56 family metallopeptidase [Marisediminicola senii]
MLTASVLLGLLAIALAWPVPLALARAAWPARAPATALVLWQAIALAGGLSMIGALLTFGLVPFGERIVPASAALVRNVAVTGVTPAVPVWHVIALCAGLLLGAHLVFNLVLTVVRIDRQRRRHRELVELLSSPIPDLPHSRLIDLQLPVAYCLPGSAHSVTVFSAGLLELLDADQLAAVIEHERAHLSQRHYLVLLAFDAWHTSLPWFPIANTSQREVGMLIEMVADDHARATVDDASLSSAIDLVAAASADQRMPPAESLGSTHGARSTDTAARVDRIRHGNRLGTAGRATVLAGSFALVAVPTVLLFAG